MRQSKIQRKTKETEIDLEIDLDQAAPSEIETGIGFFDHMLDVFSFQLDKSLKVKVKGDLEVDDHHTIEDTAIALGQAFYEAIGDKKGIVRYGSSRVPMDEALGVVDLDISGRPFLVFEGDFNSDRIGDFSTQMLEEFLRAFAMNSKITLHVHIPYGKNDHHKVEAVFKALGRALNQAVEIKNDRIPSTKGVLE